MPQQGDAPRRVGQELIIPALAVGFTTYYFWTVQELAWEAKANGIVIGAVLLLLVVLLLVRIGVQMSRGAVRLGVTLGGDPAVNRVRVALIGLTIVFMLTLPLLGTTIALALMLFSSMWLLGARHWPTLLGISLITPILVWASLVVGLGTRFPAGPFEHLMGALLGTGGGG